jgi:hypothetical protein
MSSTTLTTEAAAAAALIEDLENNAAWRRDKAAEYPDDSRNVTAAEILERLMKEAGQLGPNIRLRKLTALSDELANGNHRGLDSLVDDVSEYHRDIGFHRFPGSIYVYIDDLIEIHQRCAKRDAKTLESRVRRKARRLGYTVRKSRTVYIHANDFGEFGLLDEHGYPLIGWNYDATLEEIEGFLDGQNTVFA